jgi:glutathione S-transferase
MKIYEHKNLPNPLRVRIALAEKNVTDNFQFIPVNVLAGDCRTPDFLAKNPSAAVPVLELNDGTCISECTAIIDYIDNAFEGTSLTGETAKEKAVIAMFQRRAEANVLDAFSAGFHHGTDGLGPELEKYQNKEWGQHQISQALSALSYFDGVLATSEFVAGDKFSVADITLYAGILLGAFSKSSVPKECINLLAWQKRMQNRPSILSQI